MKSKEQIEKELKNQRELLNKAKSKEERIQYEYVVNTLEWVLGLK